MRISRKSTRSFLKNFGLHLALGAGSVVMLLPFFWMITTSIKRESQVFIFPPTWFVWPPVWENYTEALTAIPFLGSMFNSFYITAVVTVGTLFFCALAAYAFAKISFVFKRPLFALFLATMMVPIQVTLIPQFILFRYIGWINTHWPLLLPPIAINGFGVFLLRQFFRNIPSAMGDSAKIDGANHFGIFWWIMLPQIRPALAALGIFTVLRVWNEFLTPFVFLSSEALFTLPVVLQRLQGVFASNWATLMAGSTMALLPVLIVYVFAQRHFIEGIAISGVKG